MHVVEQKVTMLCSLVPRLFGGGEKKKEPVIYCLRMRLIKIWITREFEFLRKRKMAMGSGGDTMTHVRG